MVTSGKSKRVKHPFQSEHQESVNSPDRFLELEQELKRARQKSASATKLPDDVSEKTFSDFLPVLGRALFARSSDEFLAERGSGQLAAMALAAHEVFGAWLSESSASLVRTRALSPTSLVIVSILEDRPFIVNTLGMVLQKRLLHPDFFLHPIIPFAGRQVSVSIIGLTLSPEACEGGIIPPVLAELESALHDLKFVCDDFAPTVGAIQEFERDLAAQANEQLKPQAEEHVEFLRWLRSGNLVILAASVGGIRFGLLRSGTSCAEQLDREISEDRSARSAPGELLVTYTSTFSPVHRHARMLHVCVVLANGRGLSLVGVLTSNALTQEASSVPVLRKKLEKILLNEEVSRGSHDYKAICHIVDSLPKQEAFILGSEELQQEIKAILSIEYLSAARVLVRPDASLRGVWVTTIFPSERFNRSICIAFQAQLAQRFKVRVIDIDYHLALQSSLPFSRIYYFVPCQLEGPADRAALELEQIFHGLMATWSDLLLARLRSTSPSSAPALGLRYREAFTPSYQAYYLDDQAQRDISFMETLSATKQVRVSLERNYLADLNSQGTYLLTIFSLEQQLPLSRALPILENAGFEILREDTFQVSPRNSSLIFLYRFTVRHKQCAQLDPGALPPSALLGLEQILAGHAENDILNSLLFSTDLDLAAISVLHTYCLLLWQMKHSVTRQALRSALAQNPEFANALWMLFATRFAPHPRIANAERTAKFKRQISSFRADLRKLRDPGHDRTLRTLAALIEATVRTNFYRKNFALAIKVHSAKLEILGSSAPMFEIFVNGGDFEGVHLRAGQVARGGIRWSDRRDDFRSEVLGLMRTQKIKNALIVPSGAKGGFILKNPPRDRAELEAAGQRAYQDFIRALLSLTDNRVEHSVLPPEDTIVHDHPDPYLVVAADKGTAAFSDLANEIAQKEFNFWLGDAFASGGSHGYNHKRLGITARGAWECIREHFNALGINHESQPVSVVGIGDMSGDVFGNGMLENNRIRLIAAFDHRHVFIDPNPDPLVSYSERKRLFELPRSSWADYDPKLISQGGGVFGRYDREITLTPEMRAALGLAAEVPDVLSGEQLISCVLRAPVDLLYNGGIGNYVRAEDESDAAIDDASNDNVRVAASELRARVVAEGGNLGFSAAARGEFSKRGGRINSDAIDNSAGVDLSDHEVNLKLLFNSLPAAQQVTTEQRDALLNHASAEVVQQVLHHNQSQALQLSISADRSRKNIEYLSTLIRDLAKRGYIHPHQDHLPDEGELNERVNNRRGLTRPELAVLMAGGKLWLNDELVKSGLTRDPLLNQFLFDYFPPQIRSDYQSAITRHPLAQHITATQVTNTLVDLAGILAVHRLCVNHAIPANVALAALCAAYVLLGVRELQTALEPLNHFETHSDYLLLVTDIGRALRELATWLVSNHNRDVSPSELVRHYDKPLNALLEVPASVLPAPGQTDFNRYRESYTKLGLSSQMAHKLAWFHFISFKMEIVWCANSVKTELDRAASVYWSIVEILKIYSMIRRERSVDARNRWEYEFIINSYEEMRRSISMIACALIKAGLADHPERIEKALLLSPSNDQLKLTLSESTARTPEVALRSVLARQLRMYKLSWNQARK